MQNKQEINRSVMFHLLRLEWDSHSSSIADNKKSIPIVIPQTSGVSERKTVKEKNKHVTMLEK